MGERERERKKRWGGGKKKGMERKRKGDTGRKGEVAREARSFFQQIFTLIFTFKFLIVLKANL